MKQYLVAINTENILMTDENDVKLMECQIITAANPKEACMCYDFLNGFDFLSKFDVLPTVCLGEYNPKNKMVTIPICNFIKK